MMRRQFVFINSGKAGRADATGVLALNR